ncbi:hypothetical protein B0H13DRAFT_2667118 [Mycena leptocephala]|nr:hypothetical protein B0H13DRAFT_2667118 [Mycena leptocephala]
MSTHAASRKISTSIATLAAQDELGSDDEMVLDPDANMDVDRTLVDGEGGREEEGEDDDEVEEEDSDEEEEDDDDEEQEEEEELEDEEDQEEEDQDDEVVVVPQKRKRGASAKKPTEKPPAPREIEYKIGIFTAQQMKKSTSSRGPPITQVVNLYSNESWSCLKTHILAKINGVLKPTNLNFFDYTITFTIPRQVSDPMYLADVEHYDYLVKKALLIQKNPVAKIVVEPKEDSSATDKENDADTTATKPKSKNGAKSKVRNARDILPANVALNEKIGELRDRWKCLVPGGPCGSKHCFVSKTDPEHFPLSHEHIESWGAAWLKGTQFTDIDTPPNNELFDRVAAAARGAKSPLLQRRLDLKEQAAAKNTPAAPQVHINFPPEFANFLRPAATPAPADPDAFIPPLNTANMLIPHPRIPGPDLLIEDFCSLYDLDTDICDRFKEHKFKRSNAFKFVEVNELKEMGFLRGEIAELKVAIGVWSQLPVVQ